MRKVANFYNEKKKRKNVVSYINEKAEKSRNTRKKWIKWVLNRENETNSHIVHKKYVGKRFKTPRGMVQNIYIYIYEPNRIKTNQMQRKWNYWEMEGLRNSETETESVRTVSQTNWQFQT